MSDNDSARQRMQQQLDEQRRGEMSRAPQFSDEQIAMMREVIAEDTTEKVRNIIPALIGDDADSIYNTYKRSDPIFKRWGDSVNEGAG